MTLKVNICSVRVPSLPIWWRHTRNHSNYCAIMLCRFGQIRNKSVFTQLTHSAALLQAKLQANTEPFRNGLVKTRNRTVEMRNGLGTLLMPAQFPPQMKHSKLTCNFTHINMKSWFFYVTYILSNEFFQYFPFMENPFDLFFILIFIVSVGE